MAHQRLGVELERVVGSHHIGVVGHPLVVVVVVELVQGWVLVVQQGLGNRNRLDGSLLGILRIVVVVEVRARRLERLVGLELVVVVRLGG